MLSIVNDDEPLALLDIVECLLSTSRGSTMENLMTMPVLECEVLSSMSNGYENDG